MRQLHRIPRRRAPRWTFGDRLRKVRRNEGLTQLLFARRIGANVKSIDAWECDRSTPRDIVGMATLIEDEFDLPHGWMLGYADHNPDDGERVTHQYPDWQMAA